MGRLPVLLLVKRRRQVLDDKCALREMEAIVRSEIAYMNGNRIQTVQSMMNNESNIRKTEKASLWMVLVSLEFSAHNLAENKNKCILNKDEMA